MFTEDPYGIEKIISIRKKKKELSVKIERDTRGKERRLLIPKLYH